MLRYIKSDCVRLRSTAKYGKSNIVSLLDRGTSVELVGEETSRGWQRVRVRNGLCGGLSSAHGYVAARLLRSPATAPVERLLSECHKAWLQFERGSGREHEQPFAKYVGKMWHALGYFDIDGTRRDWAWSAAFICEIISCAGGYDGFVRSALHSRYIHDAIVKRQAEQQAPFWGYRLHQHKARLGDMVCCWRSTSDAAQHAIDYDYASEHSQFKSHVDIVVEVKRDAVLAIGGNVNHSVSVTRYPTNEEGFLLPKGRVFALMRNNLG